MQFSIIIPTLNEAPTLSEFLTQLIQSIDSIDDVEIIISDGGSTDDTLMLAKQFPITLLNSRQGRATQMNFGARQAKGIWLIFLHADTFLPKNWQTLIAGSNCNWGRFNVRLSGKHWLLRIIETMMNSRSCLTSIATGDQAIFFRKHFFHSIGNYPDIPLMEDIAISKKAKASSKLACIKVPVVTSSRRWQQKGIIRTILLMSLLRFAFWVGIKPNTLHRLYY